MLNEYIMKDDDFPKKHQTCGKASEKIFEREMRKMVNEFPATFKGSRWDKYRNTKDEVVKNDSDY